MEHSKRLDIERAQNFMRQYRDPESRELRKLSANQFMDVWSHYDCDGKLFAMSLMCYCSSLCVDDIDIDVVCLLELFVFFVFLLLLF